MGAEEMRKEWLTSGPDSEYKRIAKELKSARGSKSYDDLSGELVALLREKGFKVIFEGGSTYNVSAK